MNEILVLAFMLIQFCILLYITYRSFIRAKYYSGQKFVWSKKDLQISTLKGYHYYEKPLTWLYFTISLTYNGYSTFYKKVNLRIDFYLLLILLAYIIVSYFKENKLKQSEKNN